MITHPLLQHYLLGSGYKFTNSYTSTLNCLINSPDWGVVVVEDQRQTSSFYFRSLCSFDDYISAESAAFNCTHFRQSHDFGMIATGSTNR